MHELVRWIQRKTLSQPSRWPSLAGTGLPERMRSTAFAFLGLTAAAGLALVAIFAQLSFNVLSPAPLPSEPVEGSAVAEAVALDHRPGFSARADESGGQVDERSDRARDAAVAGGEGDSAQVSAPAPSASAPSEGGVAAQPTGASAPGHAPASGGSAPDPAPAPAPEPTPASGLAPGSSGPTPKPAPTPARPASPTPAAPSAPGNSSSGAAAAHASDRGVEASSKSSATVESPAAAAGSTPVLSTTTSPGSGNGKALGHEN